MSSRITLDIGFYFENQHYAQLQGYIPRAEALLIPELQIEEKQKQQEPNNLEVNSNRPSRNVKSQSKRGSEDQMIDEDENAGEGADDGENENENENEIENQEEEGDNEQEVQRQREVEDALQELEDEDAESEEESESYDSDREDDMEDMESIDSPEDLKNFTTNKTKRQKGQTKDLIQLPDRRPRKGKMLDQASEIIRREEKERKRKQYLKKQIEAHEKATIDKILNETGRKLRQREQKQIKDELEREQKSYRTLGNVPKIIEIDGSQGKLVMTHKSALFPAFMTATHDLKMRQLCTSCGKISKYTLRGGNKYACSLPCYKTLTA